MASKAAAIPGRDVAGKTGTTSDYKDAWFAGYTGGFTTVVWMGRDDARPMKRVTGGGAPAALWRGFMTAVAKRIPVQPIPAGPPAPIPAAVEPAPTTAAPEPEPQPEPAELPPL